jgi:hypothetical protein
MRRDLFCAQEGRRFRHLRNLLASVGIAYDKSSSCEDCFRTSRRFAEPLGMAGHKNGRLV